MAMEKSPVYVINVTQELKVIRYKRIIYMSHFAYACKTEGENGISRLISKMA